VGMATIAPIASLMTVKCGCPGELDSQQVDLEAIGITMHCVSCGGVLAARLANLPQAIAYLQRLAQATGYTAA
jgi:hypothetical protein